MQRKVDGGEGRRRGPDYKNGKTNHFAIKKKGVET